MVVGLVYNFCDQVNLMRMNWLRH